MTTKAPNMERGLTLKEAAQKLHKSAHWLRQNRIRLEVPHLRIGRTYSFDPEELDAWVNDQRVEMKTQNSPNRSGTPITRIRL